MNVLGIETSCDETGVALVQADASGTPRLLAQALHSQVQMHAAYGGVVPELASRDHIRRVVPLARAVLREAGAELGDLDYIACTRGPGLAGALLVGCGVATALAAALNRPVIGVHHLEGHLLSPFLASALESTSSPPRTSSESFLRSSEPPDMIATDTVDAPGTAAKPPGSARAATEPLAFPFVALLVSGGHTQLMRVLGVGRYELLGETIDDAAGEAFDKSAKLLGLPYPGGPELSRLGAGGDLTAFALPRPLLHSGDLDFSFAGLKTAVRTATLKLGEAPAPQVRADLAASTEAAIVDVLIAKSLRALERTGLDRLVVAGGVGANMRLRAQLRVAATQSRFRVYFPEPALCTDNGAMIALAAAMRLQAGTAAIRTDYAFDVLPRWALAAA